MALRTVLFLALITMGTWIETGARYFNNSFFSEQQLRVPPQEWEPRIIDGPPAEHEEFPWMVPLRIIGKKRHGICSSFLITPDFLVTAAHCIKSKDPKRFTAFLGTVNRDGPENQIFFSELIVHPGYGKEFGYDIALLRLETPVHLSKGVQTICLPSEHSNFEDTIATAMGWGVHKKDGTASLVLRFSVEHVTTNDYCRGIYGRLITDRHVCSGGGRTGVCFGDSGGPLVSFKGGMRVAIGVASFVSKRGCAVPGIPAAYSATASFVDWIEYHLGHSVHDLCVV